MSSPVIRIDTSSHVPPYEQIRAQLAALITSRRLPERERLPPVRQLAADLGLAPGTVARAYRELEAASLITSRRGAGTRVAATLPAPAPSPVAPAELAELAGRFMAEAQRLGADGKTMLDAVREALDQRPQDGATVVRGARPSSRNFEGKT